MLCTGMRETAGEGVTLGIPRQGSSPPQTHKGLNKKAQTPSHAAVDLTATHARNGGGRDTIMSRSQDMGHSPTDNGENRPKATKQSEERSSQNQDDNQFRNRRSARKEPPQVNLSLTARARDLEKHRKPTRTGGTEQEDKLDGGQRLHKRGHGEDGIIEQGRGHRGKHAGIHIQRNPGSTMRHQAHTTQGIRQVHSTTKSS